MGLLQWLYFREARSRALWQNLDHAAAAPPGGVEPLERRTLFAATKIMPLGDSITNAETGHASYRYWLWHDLVDNGYSNVDFVGSQTGVMNGPPLFPDFDQNHEGHWGWRADEILAQIGGWASTSHPDIVLMHLGTNDMFQGQSVSSTINELGSIIDTVRQSNPNVTFLFAQVIQSVNATSQLQALNNAIPTLAAQKNTAASRVIVVDQWTGYNGSADNYDGIHPNQTGEQKMANKWYAALQPLLPHDPPPVTTYLSDLNPTTQTNGWGPYERDHSNGEANPNDGGTITLNGATYAKGLGTHANSELRYSLAGGQYTNFLADIGVDDEVGNAGSVVFQVWDNLGNKLSDSGTMTGSTATRSVNVNVTGKSEIRLIVTNADGSFDSDHADWANARLTRPAGGAATVNPFNGATINEGGTYAATGSFSDSGAGPWTATVNYGDGGGDVALALNPDKTFSLSHTYADNGAYTVTVKVNNGSAIGSNSATVTVNNVAPTVSAGGDAAATAGQPFTRSGSFADPGTLDTWTATVDYGDGAGPIPLALNPDKTFTLSKTYSANGTYDVVVVVRDRDNATGSGTFHVTVTGGTTQQTTYLSDLSPTSQVNGWGPYEHDHSNGEANPNDGGPIRIAGVTYAKGLGVHAYSELHYNLAGLYDRFVASVGVDDETLGGGSIRFLVYGDNVLLFDSNVMRGNQAARSIDVSVSGVADLKLVVNDSGDNVNDDHGDWAAARVVRQVGLAVNPITGATINEGSAYNASGSFTDPAAGPWTATVNYGDGAGNQPLTLNPDKTFVLNHSYADNGSYSVVVTVSSGTTQASANATVIVNNVSPIVALGPDMGSSPNFNFSGSFADPGADTWTATVDYGDGTGAHALAINAANKTFILHNAYAYNGVYNVKVTVLDDDGGSGLATMKVTVTGGRDKAEDYLSSMPAIGNSANGWGPIERDMSNGETAAGDGHAITIGGVTYAKGLGMHAGADMSFGLAGGNYTHFISDIGVDDEEGGAGSVHFLVYLDGVLAYDSGTVRGGQPARHIDLNVTGKSTLRLLVTDNNDGKDSDHADWAAARLTT